MPILRRAVKMSLPAKAESVEPFMLEQVTEKPRSYISSQMYLQTPVKGPSTVNDGAGSGEKRRGQWKEDDCFPGLES